MLRSILDDRVLVMTVMGGAFAIGWVLYIYLLIYLKRRHPATWQALREPAIFEDRTAFRDSLAVTGFLLRRRHTPLGDPVLSRICDALLLWFLIVAVVLGVGMFRLIALDQSAG